MPQYIENNTNNIEFGMGFKNWKCSILCQAQRSCK